MQIRDMRQLTRPLCALALLAALTSALAQGLPPAQTQAGVAYLNGGIGLDESEALKAERARWPLTLVFAVQTRRRAVYASDVRVRISDAGGAERFALDDAGPYLLLRLAPGRYTVQATHDGHTLRRSVQVPADKPLQEGFAWPVQVDEETGS